MKIQHLPRFAWTSHLAAYALLLLLPLINSRATVTTDSLGWTVITPSTDSRIVYVSNAGNDTWDGLTTATPKATIAGADALIRDGYPDQMLLRLGDTFTQTLTTVAQLRWKNGRNANEPLVMSYYGSSGARPVIKVSPRFIDHNGLARNYQAFIGLDIYSSHSDPASSDYTGVSCDAALRLVGGGANIIVEDCRFRFNQTTIQSYNGLFYTNFQFTRNVVTDSWTLNSSTTNNNMQGISRLSSYE
jgi:hypothetical protein